MQKYRIVLLYVFATFISIEARPWYDDNSSGEYSENEFSEDGYAEQAFDAGYRSDDTYGNIIGSNSRGVGGYGNSGYGCNGHGGRGYDGIGYGSNGYSNSGYGGNGIGYSEYDSRRYDVRRINPNHNNFENAAFVPRSCPNCRINSFGNGNYNTNTFNLPKEMYE